jgi:hypothetical protein
MQIRSFRGLGEPAWVDASLNAPFRLGPNPRIALGPAAIRAASTGRTRDRTRPMLQQRQKVLARAPSTRDPTRKSHPNDDNPARTPPQFIDFGVVGAVPALNAAMFGNEECDPERRHAERRRRNRQ